MSALEARGVQSLHVGPIEFSVPGGECLALFGPSGSGKSLLLRALSDLDPHEGEVYLDGTEQRTLPGPEWRRRVGLLPADSAWWAATVEDHFPEPSRHLDVLGFTARILQAPVEQLSSGEKQRLALLRLLARQPEALLLDEPTANLDPDSTARVEDLVARYREERGVPVVWVAHDDAQRLRVAKRALHMQDGKATPA